jgi:hypothetical protein
MKDLSRASSYSPPSKQSGYSKRTGPPAPGGPGSASTDIWMQPHIRPLDVFGGLPDFHQILDTRHDPSPEKVGPQWNSTPRSRYRASAGPSIDGRRTFFCRRGRGRISGGNCRRCLFFSSIQRRNRTQGSSPAASPRRRPACGPPRPGRPRAGRRGADRQESCHFSQLLKSHSASTTWRSTTWPLRGNDFEEVAAVQARVQPSPLNRNSMRLPGMYP